DLTFDFLRIDVEAAGNHQGLAAAEDMDIAIAVDLAEIARDEEAVVAEFGPGLFRHPPIALEHVGSLDLDHSDAVARDLLAGFGIGDAHRHAGQLVADGAGHAVAIIRIRGVHV